MSIAKRGLVVAILCATAACSGGGNGQSTAGPTEPTTPTQATLPTSSVPVAPARSVGQPLGAKWIWDGTFTAMQPYLQELSGGSTWYEVVLCDVESTPGQYDWAAVDSVVQRAQQIGISTLLKIRVGRCWATGGTAQYPRGVANITESAMPLDMGTYTDFVQQVVRRYSPMGVDEYAVENEINSPSFWDGTPEDYATLARAAAGAIHKANPDALVVDAAISSVASGYSVVDALLRSGDQQEALDAYQLYFERRFGTRDDNPITPVHSVAELTAAMGTPYALSNIAFMDIINQLAGEHVFQVRQVHFYEQSSALAYLLDYLKANTPKTVPLEMWELGSYLNAPMTDVQLTDEVVKSTVIALKAGVTKVLWLPLAANPDGRAGDTLAGIVSATGQPQASADAFAAIGAAATAGRFEPIDCPAIEGVAFHGSPNTAFVWSTSGLQVVQAPATLRVSSLARAPHEPSVEFPPGSSVQLEQDPVEISLTGSIKQFEKAAGCQS